MNINSHCKIKPILNVNILSTYPRILNAGVLCEEEGNNKEHPI